MSVPYFRTCNCGGKAYDTSDMICPDCGKDISSYDETYYCEKCGKEFECFNDSQYHVCKED